MANNIMAERGVPCGAILFAGRNFIKKWDKKKKKKKNTPNTPKNESGLIRNDNDGRIHSSNMG